MPEEEKKHEEHKQEHHHETEIHDKKEEHKVEEKRKMPFQFKIKPSKVDIISIIILIVFIILVSIPSYISKGECEVARPAYKCESLKNVMIENCAYWGKYDCNTKTDVSLTQIEWYIGNLCDLQNQYHN